MARSIDEQIASLEARRKADAERLAELKRKAASRDRKARNHRLIEIGAIVEQATGLAFETDEQRQALSAALNERLQYTNGVPFTRGSDIADAVEMRLKPASGLKIPPAVHVPGLTDRNGGAR